MSRMPGDDNFDIDEDPDQSGGARATRPDESESGVVPTVADYRKLQEERDALYDRLARVSAEFRNTQRRLEQEKEQAVQYANGSLIKSLLPVIDNFERALVVDPLKTDVPKLLQGMQIVHDQWMKVLKQQQVEEIAPEAGTPFDPSHHEALMQQENNQYDQATVTQLMQKGYSLHGRTLRPAGVAVSKGK